MLLKITILLSLYIANSVSMECWQCYNARNNEECLQNGTLETCQELNSFCSVVVRVGNGQTRITKRCKQNIACTNNETQKKLRDNFRKCIGGNYRQEQYCYCCCDGDRCNESDLDCTPQPQPTKRTPPKPKPKCMPLEQPAFGKKTCTDKNHVGSNCTFTCDDPLDALYPSQAQHSTCLPSRRWSQEVPCCSQRCPPAATMDVAIIMDSSRSIKEHNWEVGKKFVEAILRVFPVGEDTTRYAIYRFNTEVDDDHLIYFDSHYNQTELFEGVRDIEYEGRGTLTGNALKFLKNNVLKRDKGCRMGERIPTIVILFTDGKARDNPGPIARELRKAGVELMTIWVKNKELKRVVKRDVDSAELMEPVEDETKIGKTEKQLKRITGEKNKDNFFTFESFKELSKEVVFPDHEDHAEDYPVDATSTSSFGEVDGEEGLEEVDDVHKHPSEEDLSKIDYYDGVTRDILNRLKELGCKNWEEKCRLK